jgi:hypothetical protein
MKHDLIHYSSTFPLPRKFNMGKKFGRFSWLRSADSTWRRLQYELGGHRWERGVEAGGGIWRDDDDAEDGRSMSSREDKRPLPESVSGNEAPQQRTVCAMNDTFKS